jgi:hypothetical protein
MVSAGSSIIFDDIFTINAIDKEGKKFDRGMKTRVPRFYDLQNDWYQCPGCMLIPRTMIWI